MLFSIGLLIVFIFLAYKASPVEKQEHAHVHGAGQVGLLAALALFGVDYFTFSRISSFISRSSKMATRPL